MRLFGVLLLLVSCGGPTPPRRGRVNVSLPREVDGVPSPRMNQNAPAPTVEAEVLPAVLLWCSQPAGTACTAAQNELGLAPTPTEAVPVGFLSSLRDLDDDCVETDVAELFQRLSRACGVQSRRTADQSGGIDDPSMISDIFSGSGCVNVNRPGDPTVKVHAVDAGGEPHLMARVWEIGED